MSQSRPLFRPGTALLPVGLGSRVADPLFVGFYEAVVLLDPWCAPLRLWCCSMRASRIAASLIALSALISGAQALKIGMWSWDASPSDFANAGWLNFGFSADPGVLIEAQTWNCQFTGLFDLEDSVFITNTKPAKLNPNWLQLW